MMAAAILLETARFDGWQYKFTLLYLVVQLVVVASRQPRIGNLRQPSRPASDATWFLPVYVWGLESIRHAYWWLFEAPGGGIAKTVYGLLPRAAFAGTLLVLCLAACFLSEHLARRRRLPCRAAVGTIPLPVFAAILSVEANWALWVLAMIPVPGF